MLVADKVIFPKSDSRTRGLLGGAHGFSREGTLLALGGQVLLWVWPEGCRTPWGWWPHRVTAENTYLQMFPGPGGLPCGDPRPGVGPAMFSRTHGECRPPPWSAPPTLGP